MLISWGRYPGELVEDVLAVLLLREYPSGKHFRPSNGDGGIDVLIPSTDNTGATNYQVKNFSHTIGDSQKNQIRSSLRRMQASTDAGAVLLKECRVTVPLVPTTKDEVWLQNYAKRLGFRVEWFGLSHIEGLVAKYPEVIDYFLNNGADRLSSTLGNLTQLLREAFALNGEQATTAINPQAEDDAPKLLPADALEHLNRLQTQVNSLDPLFSYDFRLTAREPVIMERPGLVASNMYGFGGDTWVVVDIFAQFPDALSFRPVNIQVRFEPSSPEERAQAEEFFDFGVKASLPATASFDLPGGLGLDTFTGRVQVSPYPQDAVPLRYDVTVADGTILAECTVITIEGAQGVKKASGYYFKAEDISRTFSVDWRFDVPKNTTAVTFHLLDIEGRPAAEVASGLDFLSALNRGTGLRISPQYGPRSTETIRIADSNKAPLWDQLTSLAADLSSIQEIVHVPVLVPDLSSIDQDKRIEIRRDALLAQGKAVRVDWAEVELHILPGEDPQPVESGPAPVRAVARMELELDTSIYTLGACEMVYQSATVEPLSDGRQAAFRITPAENNAAILRMIEMDLPPA